MSIKLRTKRPTEESINAQRKEKFARHPELQAIFHCWDELSPEQRSAIHGLVMSIVRPASLNTNPATKKESV